MYIYIYIYVYIYIFIHIFIHILYVYSGVMKTIQCAHPHHHHNGFVAACRLWGTSGGVHTLLVVSVRTNRVLNQH